MTETNQPKAESEDERLFKKNVETILKMASEKGLDMKHCTAEKYIYVREMALKLARDKTYDAERLKRNFNEFDELLLIFYQQAYTDGLNLRTGGK